MRAWEQSQYMITISAQSCPEAKYQPMNKCNQFNGALFCWVWIIISKLFYVFFRYVQMYISTDSHRATTHNVMGFIEGSTEPGKI